MAQVEYCFASVGSELALDSYMIAIVGTAKKKLKPNRLTEYYVENPSLFISVLFLDWWNGVKSPFIQRMAF
jgi:hypothetical protein